MARVTCQACGGRTEEGGFCEKCGAQLGGTRVGASGQADACPSPEAVCSGDDFDDCPWLRVDRDAVAFCVAQTSGVMRLRIQAFAETLKNLRLDLRVPSFAEAHAAPVLWYRPKTGKPREFSLTIPPLREGAYAAELELQFEHDACSHKFSAPVELYVYPAASSAKQIADSVVFNITNDIKMGHASDLHQSMDAAKVLEGFATNGNGHGVQELLDVLKTDLRAYHRLCFNETCSGSVSQPPVEALTDRLTLEVEGRLVHLVSGMRVTMGRHRSNRIATRVFEPDGPVMSQQSLRISKFHCTVEMEDDVFVIRDGGMDASGMFSPSSGGVFFNGSVVNGSLRVPAVKLPRQTSLGLAGSLSEPFFKLAVSSCRFDPSQCSRCEDRIAAWCRRGRVPALVLNRTDHVQETFVLLWSCLDLGQVVPSLQGLTVRHERGGYAWRSVHDTGWLKPGRYQVVGTEIRVKPFQQYGL